MKKYLYLLLLLIAFAILIYLNLSKPPVIESKIGSKYDFNYYIKELEEKENINIIISETDLTKNEFTYEFYDSEFSQTAENLKNTNPLGKFVIEYDSNELINHVYYEFSLNNKGVLEVLEVIVRSTLLDLTDRGYKVVSDYIGIPKTKDDKIHFKKRKYITSNKVLSLTYYNKTNSFTFIID